MRAARYTQTGPAAEVLRVEDVEPPEPGPGEVRVRVALSGVNPTDVKSRAGATGGVGDAGFQIPGQDGAGVVDAVGEGVDATRVGQRVWLWFAAWQRPWGTGAQHTVVPERQAVPLPDGASDELGASLGIPAVTAQHCLLADGPIGGLTVLVAGGAGAVGHMAIQLARLAGARVVATVSSDEKGELARRAGANAVVNYRGADPAAEIRAFAPDGVDRVVEVAPASNLALDLDVCAPHAVISSYATDGGAELAVPVRRLMVANLVLRFVLVYTLTDADLQAAVEGVAAAVRDGGLSTLPIVRFGLDDIVGAHEAVERGALGKVVVDVA